MVLNLALAMQYAGVDVPSFPVNYETKRPATGEGGFKNCSLDPDELRVLFKRKRDRVGVVPGPAGYVVMDIDVPKKQKDGSMSASGFESLKALFAQHEGFEALVLSAPRVRTPSGGLHIWLKKLDAEQFVKNLDSPEWAPGIDFRSDAGYVVGADGDEYKWQQGSTAEIPGAPLSPVWLWDLLPKPRMDGEYWKPGQKYLDMDLITDAETREMVEQLLNLGGHNAWPANEEHTNIYMMRPGKDKENSVSIGDIGPGRAKLWTPNWICPDGRNLSEAAPMKNGVFNLDELKQWLNVEVDYPEIDHGAFHGPLGEFVRLVEPTVEADPAHILVTSLVMCASMIGDGPVIHSGPIPQRTNMFAVMVGPTGDGKGSSWALAKKLMNHVDPTYADKYIASGFGSGEAFIEWVAQPEEGMTVTPGVPVTMHKKHALVKETEFAKILRIASRDGTILSHVLRDAFDGEPLEHRTRKATSIAKHHHVSVVAHITPWEILDTLTGAEAANGFGNRFLWILGQRSKTVPTGSGENEYTPEQIARMDPEDRAALTDLRSAPMYDEDILKKIGQLVKERIELARTRKRIRIGPATLRDLWDGGEKFYDQIANDHPGGLSEELIGRGRVQILKLAMLYALLDGDDLVSKVHLRAAKAIWDHNRNSVVTLWKSVETVTHAAGGNPVMANCAQQILEQLEAANTEGKLASEMRKALRSGRRTQPVFAETLAGLIKEGKVVTQDIKINGGTTQRCWQPGNEPTKASTTTTKKLTVTFTQEDVRA